MLKSLIIYPNEKTRDMGSILQIARSVAQKIEHTDANISVLNIMFDPVNRVWVVVYEWCSNPQDVEERAKVKIG